MLFNSDELLLTNHAITWILNVPVYKVAPIDITDQDNRFIQQIVMPMIRNVRNSNRPYAFVNANCMRNEDVVVIEDNPRLMSTIILCIIRFYEELKHSPDEIRIVTTLSLEVLESLVIRIKSNINI